MLNSHYHGLACKWNQGIFWYYEKTDLKLIKHLKIRTAKVHHMEASHVNY